MAEQYGPEVSELLDSDREAPKLWVGDEEFPYTSSEGVFLPGSSKPNVRVIIHELGHWHNKHFGQLPGIIEEGVAVRVELAFGVSLLTPPQAFSVSALHIDVMRDLGLSYEEFDASNEFLRWILTYKGLAIVDQIGLQELMRMTEISPQAIAEAAGLEGF